MAVLDMRPRSTISYSQYGRAMNGELLSQFHIGQMSAIQYLLHDFIAKFATMHFLTTALRSVSDSIIRVFFFCTPTKIGKMIVNRRSIAMTSIMTRTRARSDKCFKDHRMNSPHSGFVVKRKINRRVIIKKGMGSDSLPNKTSCSAFSINAALNASNSAKIANFVRAFITNNRKPLFLHNQSPITKAPWKGVWHQHGLLTFRSYPSHTEQLYA